MSVQSLYQRLFAHEDVEYVKPLVDEQGRSRKSMGNHWSPVELQFAMKGLRKVTTAVTAFKDRHGVHAYLRLSPTAKMPYRRLMLDILGEDLDPQSRGAHEACLASTSSPPPPPARPSSSTAPPPPPARPLSSTAPPPPPATPESTPPPLARQWEHYTWAEGTWHLHAPSGLVVRSWVSIPPLPSGWAVYTDAVHCLWISDATSTEWFYVGEEDDELIWL
jgi:hypothetical protein